MEIIDADLSSISKNLVLENLDELLGTLRTVNVRVEETSKRQHQLFHHGSEILTDGQDQQP